MTIIGVDPGTLVAGYGVVRAEGSVLTLLDVGIVRNAASASMPLRLRRLHESLLAAIDRHRPDEFAIETAFYSKNAQSALKIGQARGAALLAGALRELPVTEYAPREIKKAVTGNGGASKEQVRYMMMSLLRLSTAPKHLDATDALAVAVCHAFRAAASPNGHRDWSSFVAAHPERVITPKRR